MNLYVLSACPFCHRVLLAMLWAGCNDIDVIYVDDLKDEQGRLVLSDEPLFGAKTMPELYQKVGQVGSSVPLLVGKDGRFISNSSKDMVFEFLRGRREFWAGLSDDEMNAVLDDIHNQLNRAVYGVIQAGSQNEYEHQVNAIFAYLDALDSRLARQSFVLGETLSLADWFVVPTLMRFDAVYYRVFDCAKKRLADYRHLSAYLNKIQNMTGVAKTFDLTKTMTHYYLSTFAVHGVQTRLHPLPFVPVLD
ncbi:hypothetical protein B0181_00665 [Moraxella caviae]|uniref:Glutathione S-transferase, C-terminal domain n=1 Tax=Moraxella caviae TaxID=34060 RepID=A0A1T0AC30_9GAMM|nr:glutathione S-transferase C-terminal domain-containing protein [Moraxella caviae]OOR93189.1 hypothetical protein B0181_00665 [Moraxella caviae]STZ10460.1 Glutathione S-transferase, C-terminal domain [Moraxella caviae]VEW10680.1 Glutathione S-transferase, C-terminal domain [Moraxella caviae]